MEEEGGDGGGGAREHGEGGALLRPRRGQHFLFTVRRRTPLTSCVIDALCRGRPLS